MELFPKLVNNRTGTDRERTINLSPSTTLCRIGLAQPRRDLGDILQGKSLSAVPRRSESDREFASRLPE